MTHVYAANVKLSGVIRIDRKIIADQLEINKLALEKYWKHLAAHFVFYRPESFPILNTVKLNFIEKVIRNHSDVEFLQPG